MYVGICISIYDVCIPTISVVDNATTRMNEHNFQRDSSMIDYDDSRVSILGKKFFIPIIRPFDFDVKKRKNERSP